MTKYNLLIINLLFLNFSLVAQNKLEGEAEKFYADKNYQQAAQIYETLMKQGKSADLYYNYANTQFKLNNLGQAILFYERALVLSPYDSDIRRSLEFANTMTTDKIAGYHSFFLVDWFESVGKIFNTNQWAYICIGLFVLSLILGFIFLFSSILSIRKISFYISIVALVLAIISFIYTFHERQYLNNNPYAIVTAGSTSVKASPTLTGKELFVLHEGTKVRVIDSKDNWDKVEIADRRIGWLQKSTVEGI